MSKKLTKSGKTLFKNTMRMVNFSNRLKEENMMWRKHDKFKKRKLDESEDDSDHLAYENRYFKDESMSSMNNSMKMDVSMQDSNELSKLRHLDEVKLRKTPKKKLIRTSSKPIRSTPRKDSPTSDSESSSSEESECMVDNSFSSIDERLLKTPSKSSKTAFEKKIKLREKMLKKQMSKQKKKDKVKKSKKKSKKHKK